MAKIFLNHNRPNDPRYEPAVFEDPSERWRNRVIVLGRPAGPRPSVPWQNSFQSIPIVLITDDEALEAEPYEPSGTVPADWIVPTSVPSSIPADLPRDPRTLHGRILCDESGRLYERRRNWIRPLNRFVSRVEQGPFSFPAPPEGQAWGGDFPFDFEERAENERPPDDRETERFESTGTAPYASYRKLLHDPGVSRVVRYGEFKEMLQPQLAHPERLRDTHYLTCYVQVYEASVAQRLEWLATAVLRHPADASQFHPLTEAMAQKLELIPFFRSRSLVPPHLRRDPSILWPRDRVVRLQLADDPTIDVEPNRQPAREGSKPTELVTSATTQGTSSAAAATGPKNTIPERFLKPWEFQLSRDEVLYDMKAGRSVLGSLTSSLGRLRGWIRNGQESRKWQALLCGKNPEEQLWAVRPPQGGVAQPATRDWARRTLDQAGYDPEAMLLEWEIFWRRKGL